MTLQCRSKPDVLTILSSSGVDFVSCATTDRQDLLCRDCGGRPADMLGPEIKPA